VTELAVADRDGAREPRAFFVYGTLRPGQPNFRRVSELVLEAEPAALPDHVLYGRGMPYPYVAPGSGRVVGDLLWISPEGMREALRTLDALEGYRRDGHRNHYERRDLTVLSQRGAARAWVYVAGRVALARLTPDLVVAGGDWCRTGRPTGTTRR